MFNLYWQKNYSAQFFSLYCTSTCYWCITCPRLRWHEYTLSFLRCSPLAEYRHRQSTCPQSGMCCGHGKVKLPSLRVPPLPLYNLFTADTFRAKEFRTNITQYNVSLAFTSLGVKVDHSIIGNGPPVFRIQGELRHLSGSLLPEESQTPCYSQPHIYDSNMAYRYRISRNENFSLSTMRTLQRIMWDHNAYINMRMKFFEDMMLPITLSDYVSFQAAKDMFYFKLASDKVNLKLFRYEERGCTNRYRRSVFNISMIKLTFFLPSFLSLWIGSSAKGFQVLLVALLLLAYSPGRTMCNPFWNWHIFMEGGAESADLWIGSQVRSPLCQVFFLTDNWYFFKRVSLLEEKRAKFRWRRVHIFFGSVHWPSSRLSTLQREGKELLRCYPMMTDLRWIRWWLVELDNEIYKTCLALRFRKGTWSGGRPTRTDSWVGHTGSSEGYVLLNKW